MKNNGLFSTLFIEDLKEGVELDDAAKGRMATLAQTWRTRKMDTGESLWDTFLKQAVSYLQFVPPTHPDAPGVYSLYEDWSHSECIAVLYLIKPGGDIDDTAVGRFYPAKLLAQLKGQKLNWGILTDGAKWRLYSTKSSRPYEDYVELPLVEALEANDEPEYGLFERFFHKASFVPEDTEKGEESKKDEAAGVYKCRLDLDREQSEAILDEWVKAPFLYQVDEVLQYLCNGFIHDTPKKGEEYTEEERAEIFESAVKLLYRCLFLFYAEARRLLPSDAEKADVYQRYSIRALCQEARKFRWGKRKDFEHYDLWKHLKGLVNAVNDGDPEYGIMGYNGGLFDDSEEKFLGEHQLRNDFLARALYLMAYVEPFEEEKEEYEIPYEDLEVRHLGELYENILEYSVMLADADRIRRRTKKGVELLLASQTKKQQGDTLIRKGDVFFGESAFERKQTGSYYTPESLVRFLNQKTIVQPLIEKFEKASRKRFNEFLSQAVRGHDAETRRGAAQSAAALVERFVQEEVLKFKVCDLAMGSGHFLVDAENQMAGLVVALIEEIPDVPGLRVTITSQPNSWRRLITRYCLYGVDLNPLAVNLAKLSLWLNSFAIEHRLTFLDHHLRSGNSLIGILSLRQLRDVPKRKKEGLRSSKEKLLFDYDAFSTILSKAASEVASIVALDEDDTEGQKAAFEDAREIAFSKLRPVADLYTAYLMDADIDPEAYHSLFNCLAEDKLLNNPFFANLGEVRKNVRVYSEWHHFFHWPLEFPDIFGSDGIGGFSAIVGNPPWDVLQPSTLEFYVPYAPDFRQYDKQEALRVIQQLHDNHPRIAEKWRLYEAGFQQASSYFKEPCAYSNLDKGKIDLYKAFLERFFVTLRDEGQMGIVVPSGIYTDQSSQSLRERFFSEGKISFLYCFENRWPTVFGAVDNRFKFVTFGLTRGGKTREFKCAFMEHDAERLPAIDANALRIDLGQIHRFSPESLDIMEFRTQRALEVTQVIYGEHPLLRDRVQDTWNVALTQDFNLTSDSHLFNREKRGLPLIEGKAFFSFDHLFGDVGQWIDEKYVREKFCDKKWKKLIARGKEPEKTDYEFYRGAFRRIAASTNERTLIATVLPSRTVCPHTVFSIQRLIPDGNGDPITLMNSSQMVWLIAVLNSFVVDYVIRLKISTGLDMHFVYTLPVPRFRQDSKENMVWGEPITARGLRLLCTSQEFAELWTEVFNLNWKSREFWYPGTQKLEYGVRHEHEIRRRIVDSAETLSRQWAANSGMYDRLTDRRDCGDRAQIRAEIDAYVAHLYGLSRDDFAYILDTFPGLRRKEEKAFGEFLSKRKCLEEYDRLAQVLT
jgi:type I restriction-modification system DNA methylase subunit